MFRQRLPVKRGRALLVTGLCCCAFAGADEQPPVTDPTEPPHMSAGRALGSTPAEPLLLHSTHVAASSRSAVVNRKVVAVGSRINGAVVTAIEPGLVTLRRGSESISLRLELPPVKNPAKDEG